MAGSGVSPVVSRPGPDLRWAALATRNARLLLATRMVAQGSDGLLQAALGSFVLFSPERQATAAQVAGTFAVLLVPYSLVGPFAGVFLDRWSRVRVLVVANLIRAGVILVVAAQVSAGRDGIDLGAVVLIALGCARLVLAGLSAALPHAVPREALVTANALFPTSGTIASAAATVVGLMLARMLGEGASVWLVVIVAGLLVVAAGLAALIPRTELGPDTADPAGSRALTRDLVAVLAGMIAGVRHVHARRGARRAMAVVVVHRFAFGALLIDILLVVRATLNSPAQADHALTDFALAAAAASLGALAAAVLTPLVCRRLTVTNWAGVTMIAAAATIPGFLWVLNLPMLVVGAVAMGFSGQAVKIAGDTVLQREVTDDYRGRVFALYDVALNLALVGGILATALLVPASGRSPFLWAGVSVLLVATGSWSLRPVRSNG